MFEERIEQLANKELEMKIKLDKYEASKVEIPSFIQSNTQHVSNPDIPSFLSYSRPTIDDSSMQMSQNSYDFSIEKIVPYKKLFEDPIILE